MVHRQHSCYNVIAMKVEVEVWAEVEVFVREMAQDHHSLGVDCTLSLSFSLSHVGLVAVLYL